jgi:DNA-binding protein YbaB
MLEGENNLIKVKMERKKEIVQVEMDPRESRCS